MSDKKDSGYLITPNTLRKLAGHDDELQILEYMGDEYFGHVGDETMSVEIMTLSQHRYELAFEYLAMQEDFTNMDIGDMSNRVSSVLHKFDDVPPHVQVNNGEIIVVVDCTKIDTQIVEYASQLLSYIPSTEPGFYWEYLNTEK